MPLRRYRPLRHPPGERRGGASAHLARGRNRRPLEGTCPLLEGRRVAAERALEQRAYQHLQHHRLELVGDEEFDIAAAPCRRPELPPVVEPAEWPARIPRAFRCNGACGRI